MNILAFEIALPPIDRFSNHADCISKALGYWPANFE